MTCDDVRELLELYALGAVEPDDRVQVREHLDGGCRACSQALSEALALNAAVLASAPEVAAPPSLRKRVLSTVRPQRASWWSPAWAAVAAGLAIATVWFGLGSRNKDEAIASLRLQRHEDQRAAARATAALQFLQDPETRPAATGRGAREPRGTYYVNPRGGVLLIASNLTPPGPGKTYQMWMIPRGGQAPRPAGLFVPDPNGAAVHIQGGPVDVASVQALAITVEPEGGSAAPTTTPMLVTPVAD